MADRPSPPPGYKTWIEYAIANIDARAVQHLAEGADPTHRRLALMKAKQAALTEARTMARVVLAAKVLYDLLAQADPTGTPGRHEEWPLQIIAAEDTAPALAAALTKLGRALGRCPEDHYGG